MTADDTLKQWADVGLFDPVADDAAEVRELLEYFDSEGIDPLDYSGVHPDDLVSSVSLRTLRPGLRLTAEQARVAAGLGSDSFERLCRSSGYALDGEFTDMDVEAFKIFGAAAGIFSEEALNDFARTVASAMARIADAATALFRMDIAPQVEAAGGRQVDYARKNHEVASLINSMFGAMRAYFLNQLTEAVRVGDYGRRAATSGAMTTINVAIGFVDIVGYTQLSTSVPPDELATFIRSFESRSIGIVGENGGRLVKLIGDAIMFLAVEPDDAVATARAIVEAFDDAQALPRGGVATGEVIAMGGDYYGEVVNLASRIADLAVPGEVLVDDQTALRSTGHEFEGAGRRQLKGFAEPVALSSLRR